MVELIIGPDGVERPETAADTFTEIAHWLDLADQAFKMIAEAQGKDWVPGSQAQIDLRRLAEYLRKHPTLDGRLYRVMTEFSP